MLQVQVNSRKYLIQKNRMIAVFSDRYVENKPVSVIALENKISKVRVYQILSSAIKGINRIQRLTNT
jgi:DNA-directed RNA polymerase specialized sigma subunit